MSQLCFLTNLSSSDMAAWVQAVASSLAIIVGAGAVYWQTRRARLEQSEREARALDAIGTYTMLENDGFDEVRRAFSYFWENGMPVLAYALKQHGKDYSK